MKDRTLKAIDLYSGIGGWSLGLRLSGIEVVSSYEWWPPASLTNEVNNSHMTVLANIRKVAEEGAARTEVDLIVGSPPCTQFSFANRGGNGDIADGFRDLAAFFEIVMQCRPKWWAMENVPRVAVLLPEAILPGRPLYKYRDLVAEATIEVVNCADFGIPQARKRCLVGNFDFSLLNSYRGVLPRRTLGDVVSALGGDTVVDPIYGLRLGQTELTDHEKESPLTAEEERLNRESKTHHPVYNAMSFPERLSQPARTITATCTRVSRESLVVQDGRLGGYRRLTIRERASLQSFPINYQLMGSSASDKMKMVGNAIPPLLTFLIGEAIQGKDHPELSLLEGAASVNPKNIRAPKTPTEGRGGKYREDRTFRLALPNLRFKSGTRFELSNADSTWKVSFFYGNSKDIRTLQLTVDASDLLKGAMPSELASILHGLEQSAHEIGRGINSETLQRVWSNRGQGIHPFEVVDALGELALSGINALRTAVSKEGDRGTLVDGLVSLIGDGGRISPKLSANAAEIAVGIAVASGFNSGVKCEELTTRQ